MPNWVSSTLTVEGNPKLVKQIKKQMNKPFKVKHDTWNMDIMEMEVKEFSYPNPIFAFWNIVAPTDLEAYIKQPQQSKLESGAVGWWEDTMAIAKVDNSWYNWNMRNWGVKWDVAVSSDEKYPETELYSDEPNGENHVLVYGFQTAWGVPVPALEKLSEQYPSVLFTLSYEEETGWGGEMEIANGKIYSHSEYDWQCRECGHTEDETPYCETCEFDMCPKCGYGEPMDQDRAKCEEHKDGNK